MRSCCSLKRDLASQWNETFDVLLQSLQPPVAVRPIHNFLSQTQDSNTLSQMAQKAQAMPRTNALVAACSYRKHSSSDYFECASNFSFKYTNDGISVGFNLPPDSEQFVARNVFIDRQDSEVTHGRYS